jgi:hypothetical protein
MARFQNNWIFENKEDIQISKSWQDFKIIENLKIMKIFKYPNHGKISK